jgi:hypothetical protein
MIGFFPSFQYHQTPFLTVGAESGSRAAGLQLSRIVCRKKKQTKGGLFGRERHNSEKKE